MTVGWESGVRAVRRLALALLLVTPSARTAAQAAHVAAQADYVADVEFAIAEIEKQCGELLRAKEIDWRAVSAPILADAHAVHDTAGHLVVLTRLLARLHDGHCEVRTTPKSEGVQWPADPRGVQTGPGMFWCRSGGKIYVKNVWNEAERLGIAPGMEVLEVDGQPVAQWLEHRMAEIADRLSFSSPQQAFFFACTQGLADFPGTKRTLVLKKPKGKKSERELVYRSSNPTPWGPAFPPKVEAVTEAGDVRYGFTDKKWGYLHLRRAPEDLPDQVDRALEHVGTAKGLILDFRGNSGGGFDHDAFMGRFVPSGKTFPAASGERVFSSAGAHPYGGPIVAIVDGTVRSAGETAAGLFKDDGRGYVIGESATAGMSSQKTEIELPSGLFKLCVSTATNMGRYNGGKGLEGIGVVPHRVVEFDPADLEQGVDTLIRTAEELLAKFPQKDVRYDPKDFGWKR